MKRNVACLLFLVVSFASFSQTLLIDDNWKFHRGGAQGAEDPSFNDSEWRSLDLPHDWSIEDLPGTNSPFSPDAISQVSGGFTTGGTGWYRKTISIPAEWKGKRVTVIFDGVYMNSQCWINGKFLGEHPYGYTSFWFDLTDNLNYGEDNFISVQVRNEGQNSRWYTGSGIYRHVWLKVSDPVYFDQWGVSITSAQADSKNAKLNLSVEIGNTTVSQSRVTLKTKIIDSKGIEIVQSVTDKEIPAGSQVSMNQEISVANPALWSIENPVLYKAVCELYCNSKICDKIETPFGIRTISFDTTYGFRLNGIPVKLKGGCVHHDNGPLGSRAYDRAEERRVELLKASGFNAIRCSHNPPSPAFLDACDRLGMLVIDEAFDMWRIANNPYDYHLYFDDWWEKDVSIMIKRDRNHPSVIIWSIGNEIRDMENPAVIAVGKKLADYFHKTDPTRPVTAAVNNLRPQKDPYFAILDIGGYNYAAGGDHGKKDIYETDHERVPQRIMMGTESYASEAFGAWMPVVKNNYVIGDFVWTAFDYIGEASIGWLGYWQKSTFFPWNLAYCGDIDICGWKRPQSYYRDALWKTRQLSLFVEPPVPSFALNSEKQSWSIWDWQDVVPSWNWTGYEDKPLKVWTYSSFDYTELFVNGRSLGKKMTNQSEEYRATWQVPYEAGEIKAVGYSGKKAVATSVLKTAGEPMKIRVIADRTKIKADNQDLSYITVELVDNAGNLNPVAENMLLFKVEGEGSLIAVGNANPVSTESYQLPRRKAWRGKCLAVVKSSHTPGSIKLTVYSEGLGEGTVDILSE